MQAGNAPYKHNRLLCPFRKRVFVNVYERSDTMKSEQDAADANSDDNDVKTSSIQATRVAHESQDDWKNAKSVHANKNQSRDQGVYLNVLPVRVGTHMNDKVVTTYAMLDTCSDDCLCDSEIIRRLDISGVPNTVNVKGAAGARKLSTETVQLYVTSIDGSDTEELTSVESMNNAMFTGVRTPEAANISTYRHLSDMEFPMVDIDQVTILIGANVTNVFVTEQAKVPYNGDKAALSL